MKKAINLAREHADLDLPETAKALLIIEVDGPESALDEASEKIKSAANNASLLDFGIAKTLDEAKHLWHARKALSPALRHVAPKKINEDIVVPVSLLPDLFNGLKVLSEKYHITIVNFGHAGNGNIHVNLLIDPSDSQQVDNAKRCLAEVFALVISLQGTLSGEHGVGLAKQNFIATEIDPTTLDLMQRIKREFDPNNILNPGKIFPA